MRLIASRRMAFRACHSSATASAARPYLQRVREFYPRTPIFLLLPVWRQDAGTESPRANAAGQTYAQYRQELARIAASVARVTVLEPGELLPPAPALLIDGLHPNTEGHVVYGLNLAQRLKRLQPAQ